MRLPDFPWDSLASAASRARQHPGGLIDLSVGTPVDPTPEVIRQALQGAADAPGYPQAWGTPDLRAAVAQWFASRRRVTELDPDGVLPTVGSKEFVAWLPTMLGLGAGDVVAHPEIAYPTYDVGARIAGATPLPTDVPFNIAGPPPKLVWVNSPSNPTGRVWRSDELAAIVAGAREVGAVVASDECYAELGWSGEPLPSILDPAVCGGSHQGLLVVYSLSKQSNLAGYRAGFAAGDPVLVQRLLAVRRHAGMMVPWPIQRAMLAALGDAEHVVIQRERYRRRRESLTTGLRGCGFTVDHSDAGLYLWVTRGASAAETVDFLAAQGILVAPGTFYGKAGARHVRVALTAADGQIDQARDRLLALG
ncbi:MAG: succinyldiaminopimelate transaminase [Actinomycetota bacterium]